MFSYPGRDPEVAIGEQAAEGGDKSALAGMGGGAEDHEKAGHALGRLVRFICRLEYGIMLKTNRYVSWTMLT